MHHCTAIPKNLVPRVYDAPQKSEKEEKLRKIMKNHGKEKKKQQSQSHIDTAIPPLKYQLCRAMVYHRVSIDMKQCALQLLQCRWEVDAVVEALSVLKKSINRWANNLEHKGSVEALLSFQGCPCILWAEIIAELVDLVHQNPTLYLYEIAKWLALVHDQPIPCSTLQCTLASMNIAYKQLQQTAAEHDEVAQANWCKAMRQHYTAEQMVFTDESSNDDCNFHH